MCWAYPIVWVYLYCVFVFITLYVCLPISIGMPYFCVFLLYLNVSFSSVYFLLSLIVFVSVYLYVTISLFLCICLSQFLGAFLFAYLCVFIFQYRCDTGIGRNSPIPPMDARSRKLSLMWSDVT